MAESTGHPLYVFKNFYNILGEGGMTSSLLERGLPDRGMRPERGFAWWVVWWVSLKMVGFFGGFLDIVS